MPHVDTPSPTDATHLVLLKTPLCRVMLCNDANCLNCDGLPLCSYMSIVSYGFFCLTGTIGFYACYIFVRQIYSAVKVCECLIIQYPYRHVVHLPSYIRGPCLVSI